MNKLFVFFALVTLMSTVFCENLFFLPSNELVSHVRKIPVEEGALEASLAFIQDCCYGRNSTPNVIVSANYKYIGNVSVESVANVSAHLLDNYLFLTVCWNFSGVYKATAGALNKTITDVDADVRVGSAADGLVAANLESFVRSTLDEKNKNSKSRVNGVFLAANGPSTALAVYLHLALTNMAVYNPEMVTLLLYNDFSLTPKWDTTKPPVPAAYIARIAACGYRSPQREYGSTGALYYVSKACVSYKLRNRPEIDDFSENSAAANCKLRDVEPNLDPKFCQLLEQDVMNHSKGFHYLSDIYDHLQSELFPGSKPVLETNDQSQQHVIVGNLMSEILYQLNPEMAGAAPPAKPEIIDQIDKPEIIDQITKPEVIDQINPDILNQTNAAKLM